MALNKKTLSVHQQASAFRARPAAAMKIVKRKDPALVRARRATIDIEELNALHMGDQAWCRSEKTTWQPCKVLMVTPSEMKVKIKPEEGPERTVDLHIEEVFPQNPEPADDMTACHHMHEPGIMKNLEDRQHKLACDYLTFLKLAVDLKLMDTTSLPPELAQWASRFEKRRRAQLKARDRLKPTEYRDWLAVQRTN